MVPAASTGIFGALVLGFGRALGETMALAMLIGNSNQISLSLFSPANTLAALLALNFPEAGPREVQVLMYAALVLLAITLVVNMAGEDRSAGFYVVHSALAVISIGFGVAVGVVGWKALRARSG